MFEHSKPSLPEVLKHWSHITPNGAVQLNDRDAIGKSRSYCDGLVLSLLGTQAALESKALKRICRSTSVGLTIALHQPPTPPVRQA
jgi:hypothetical protein